MSETNTNPSGELGQPQANTPITTDMIAFYRLVLRVLEQIDHANQAVTQITEKDGFSTVNATEDKLSPKLTARENEGK